MTGYKEIIKRGFLINFSMAILIAIFGYITRIILAKNLTLEQYGLFYAVFSFVGFFNLFRDLGIRSTVTKFISEYNAKLKEKEIKATIITSFLFQLGVVLLISSVLLLLANLISKYFFKTDANLVLIFIIFSFVFSISQDVFSAIAAGFKHMLYANISEFLRHILIILVLIIGLNFNKTAVLPAFAYFIVTLFLPFLHFPLLLKLFPNFLKIKESSKKRKLGQILVFAFPVLLSTAGGMIIAYSDTLMITYFKTMKDVALYNIAIPTSMILWYFGNSLAMIMLPSISEMWNKKQKNYVKEAIQLLHKYSFVILIPLGLIFFTYPEIIIRVLFGEKFIGAANALRILSLGAIAYNVAIINSNILIAVGKPKINSRIMLSAAVFNIIMNFILVPIYGIVGAAITTTVSYFLIFILSTIIAKKITKANLPILQYLKTVFAGFIFLLSVTILKKYLVFNAYLEAIIVLAISFVFYLLCLLITKTISLTEIRKLLSKNV